MESNHLIATELRCMAGRVRDPWPLKVYGWKENGELYSTVTGTKLYRQPKWPEKILH